MGARGGGREGGMNPYQMGMNEEMVQPSSEEALVMGM